MRSRSKPHGRLAGRFLRAANLPPPFSALVPDLKGPAAMAETLPPRPAAETGRLKQPMAFFRTINFSEPLPSIEGEGVTLRTPQMTDFEEWAALREVSRDFLKPWEPTWPVDDLTRAAFRRRIKRYAEDLRSD